MAGFVLVIASFKAKPGKEGEAEVLLKSLVAPTHAEPGCLMYALHKRLDQPGMFYFVEQWRSQQDVDEHLRKPYIGAAFKRKDELFDLADIAMVQPADAGQSAKGTLFKIS